EVRGVKALYDALAGKVVDQVDLSDDRRRALHQDHLGAVFLDLPQPVDPVTYTAGVDTLDLRHVDDRGPAADLVAQAGELVVLVDDAGELYVGDVLPVVYRGLELGIHCRRHVRPWLRFCPAARITAYLSDRLM